MTKKKPHISYIVSLCGIMSGLAIVMMFFLNTFLKNIKKYLILCGKV